MSTKDSVSSELNLIAAGTVFEGKIRTPGSLRIDGRLVGDIMATQNVSIGSSGDVTGNISAKNITIGGKVAGSVIAQEKLVFEPKAIMKGDVRASKLVISEGAVYDGQCVMSDAKGPANLVELRQDIRRAEEK